MAPRFGRSSDHSLGSGRRVFARYLPKGNARLRGIDRTEVRFPMLHQPATSLPSEPRRAPPPTCLAARHNLLLSPRVHHPGSTGRARFGSARRACGVRCLSVRSLQRTFRHPRQTQHSSPSSEEAFVPRPPAATNLRSVEVQYLLLRLHQRLQVGCSQRLETLQLLLNNPLPAPDSCFLYLSLGRVQPSGRHKRSDQH